MNVDFYRYRLKAAGFGWMERGHRWGGHRFGHRNKKDRVMSRAEKRGARQDALRDAEDAA